MLARGSLECPGQDLATRLAQQVDQEGDVVQAQQARAERLGGLDEMVEVGARVLGAYHAATGRIERLSILASRGAPQVDPTTTCVGVASAAQTSWQHTVEQIDPSRHRRQHLLRLADAHQVAWPVVPQISRSVVENGSPTLSPPIA